MSVLRPFPVDRRRVPELEAQGYRVVDELVDDWRGEFLVLMDGPEPPCGRGWLPFGVACSVALSRLLDP